MYLADVIENIIQGVAEAHLTPHGVSVTTTMSETGVLLVASKKGWSCSRYIRIGGLSADIQSEVAHCAAHALALEFLTHEHPT